jgi:secreted trypsin-like serine protease
MAVFTINEHYEDIPVAQISIEKIRVGDNFAVVGYGCEDNFVDASVPDGLIARRKVGSKFAGVPYGDPSLKSVTGFVKQNLFKRYIYTKGVIYTDSRTSICFGDSGGPIFFNRKLVGVASFAYANDSGHAFNNFFTRLSYETNWLKAFIEK